jgi:hypothetical protein
MAGLAVVLNTNLLLSGLAYPASVPGRLIDTTCRCSARGWQRCGWAWPRPW